MSHEILKDSLDYPKKSLEAYLKIEEHSFYRIRNGEATSVNTERMAIKRLVSLPSGYMTKVKVITKEEFDNALDSINP